MSLLRRRNQGYTFAEARRLGLSLSSPRELFAEIALDVNIKDISERLFTYEIPEQLQKEVFIGSQVLVPFGKQELMSGYVVSIRDRDQVIGSAVKNKQAHAALPEKTRAISEVIDSSSAFAPAYVEFLYWVAQHYLCSISDVLSAAIPAEIGPRVKRMVRLSGHSSNPEANELSELLASPAARGPEEQIKATLKDADKSLSLKSLKERSKISASAFYSALARLRRKGEIEVYAQAEEAAQAKTITYLTWTGEPAGSKRQEEILNCLKRHNGGLPSAELIKESKCSAGTIKKMLDEGILSQNKVDSFRDPLKGHKQIENDKPELTPKQAEVLDVLYKELQQKLSGRIDSQIDECPWLLHGVTGSGKTEIYLRLIEETLKQGRSALLLVPEISLTPQLARRLVNRFGEQVAVWHSALSAGERFDTWRRIQSGELKLLLGARSAILAQVPNLGLIILDEEHDSSYKQSTPNPRYSAKHLARERGRRESCLV
ncbi:MAG: DEAD/DEAH box helicase family protein, partial [Candidatus Obscuribacterales bacterium]|nr:DEAD/DEAH box helicase family protein [Candidatus Obscuribacterales bacterium]